MRFRSRVLASASLALALGACSLGSVLGGGGKAPATLLTLSAEAPATGEFTRAVAAGRMTTVETCCPCRASGWSSTNASATGHAI